MKKDFLDPSTSIFILPGFKKDLYQEITKEFKPFI